MNAATASICMAAIDDLRVGPGELIQLTSDLHPDYAVRLPHPGARTETGAAAAADVTIYGPDQLWALLVYYRLDLWPLVPPAGGIFETQPCAVCAGGGPCLIGIHRAVTTGDDACTPIESQQLGISEDTLATAEVLVIQRGAGSIAAYVDPAGMVLPLESAGGEIVQPPRRGVTQRSPALFTSASAEWRTPPDLFARLNAVYRFDVDAAADDANALLPRYWTAADDGLAQDWRGLHVYCNPPYGRQIGKWVRKAAESWRAPGTLIVFLVPAHTGPVWWQRWVLPEASYIYFVPGRLTFQGAPNSAPFDSAIVVWGALGGQDFDAAAY